MFSSDEEIIISYKNGDEQAFKLLVDRYASSIFNFTRRLTDKTVARDLTQETFIKAWKSIKKFQGSKSSFKTWIFTIARNTAFDYLRKRRAILFSDLEDTQIDDLEDLEDERILPEEAFQKMEDAQFLNRSLAELSSNYQTILIFHYQEELTFDEIAKILNKPLNTVKSQHRRAIIELRKIIFK